MPLDNIVGSETMDITETKLNASIDKINALDLVVPESASGTPKLNIKRIDIGDWDMDSTASVSIDTGIQRDNMLMIQVMIRPDLNSSYMPLNTVFGAAGTLGGGIDYETTDATAMFVKLTRTTAGHFDSTTYDSTTYNRGYITIIYVE